MTDNGVRKANRHEEFYIRDGNICFLVEHTLFQVHHYFFERESTYFRTCLNPPRDGSPANPHIIEDVTSDEFTQLLRVWYNPRYSFSEQGQKEWVTILRLTSKWGFGEMRMLAIRQLENLKLDPIEKILLYKEHSVDQKLIIPSYVSLCRRQQHLSPEEGKALGMETVLKLASAREQAISTAAQQGSKNATTASVADHVLEGIIASSFGILTSHLDGQTVGVAGQTMNNGCHVFSNNSQEGVVDGGQQAVQQGKSGKKNKPNGA